MTDSCTANIETGSPELERTATGHWGESFQNRSEKNWNIPGRLSAVGVAIVLVTSPATAVADAWAAESKGCQVTTALPASHVPLGRRISRGEALRITRQVLARAEEERLIAAEYEAARGIQWEDKGDDL